MLPELTLSERAKKRCHFHYKRSQRIGQRVYITEISSEGLVAATVVGRCQTLVKVVSQRELDQPDLEYFGEYEYDVDIPVWICDPRLPQDRTDLTEADFARLQLEMYISITEIRASNLKDGPTSRAQKPRNCICASGYSYVWLACGTIPRSRILRVMPFDRKTLHEKRTTQVIRSRDSTEPWVWDS